MAKSLSWKLNELVTLVVLSVALGVLWWGWTFFTALTSPLSSIGLNYLFVGVWFTGGTLVPYLIRRPGAAFLGEVLAALVEGFITQWGITAIIWGAVQGFGAELVFFLTGYKRYNVAILMLAGALSGIFSYILDFFYSHYAGLELWVIFTQIGSIIVGGLFWGGFVAWAIGKGILKTGVLQNLGVSEE